MATPAYNKNGQPIRAVIHEPKPKVVRLTGRSKTYIRRDTDITLDPEIVASMKKGMRLLDLSQSGLVTMSLQRFFLHLTMNPTAVIPRATSCPNCGRQLQDKRPKNRKRRIRVSITLTDADVSAITWIADNYYHGVFSRSLEAALIFFLPEDILPAHAKERL